MFSYGTSAALVPFWNAGSIFKLATEIERNFVQVAPSPVFAGLERAHDGMFCGVKVLCGVFVFRRVAAADVSTFKTEA